MTQNQIIAFEDQFDTLEDIPSFMEETSTRIQLWCPYVAKRDLSFLQARRLKVLLQNTQPFPPYKVLERPRTQAKRWCIYFAYLPDGKLQPYHRYTVERLVADGITPLVICAAPRPEDARALYDLPIGGLVWKGLNGYDFSGYTVGLEVLAELDQSISLFVMNDSVLGPFSDMAALFESSPWKLTGLVASEAVETHFQSFLFHIRDFSGADMPTLSKVFFRKRSFNAQNSVSFLQETRIPSGFRGKFSAGSVLAPAPGFARQYYMLSNPAGLLRLGVPVIKRSIFGKLKDGYDQARYGELLSDLGHPPLI